MPRNAVYDIGKWSTPRNYSEKTYPPSLSTTSKHKVAICSDESGGARPAVILSPAEIFPTPSGVPVRITSPTYCSGKRALKLIWKEVAFASKVMIEDTCSKS